MLDMPTTTVPVLHLGTVRADLPVPTRHGPDMRLLRTHGEHVLLLRNTTPGRQPVHPQQPHEQPQHSQHTPRRGGCSQGAL